MQPIDKKVKVFYKYISDKNKKNIYFALKQKEVITFIGG